MHCQICDKKATKKHLESKSHKMALHQARIRQGNNVDLSDIAYHEGTFNLSTSGR